MKIGTILERLATAEKHAAAGAKLLERQRIAVRERERDGLDTTESRDLLVQLENAQQLHLAERDRLWAELARSVGQRWQPRDEHQAERE
jgi:hypothetical protein